MWLFVYLNISIYDSIDASPGMLESCQWLGSVFRCFLHYLQLASQDSRNMAEKVMKKIKIPN